MPQFHFQAAESIGGVANGVKVPLMETSTNKTPSAAYFKRKEMTFPKKRSAKTKAAKVMASGLSNE